MQFVTGGGVEEVVVQRLDGVVRVEVLDTNTELPTASSPTPA
jgi:hypothetical protein